MVAGSGTGLFGSADMLADKVRKDIYQIFKKKEKLAKYAYQKEKISVREFKKYINEKYPSDEIDLTNLPSIPKLRKQDPKELARHLKRAKRKLDQVNVMVRKYTISIKTLETVLAEK